MKTLSPPSPRPRLSGLAGRRAAGANLLAAFLAGCGGPDMNYRPSPQILPAHIKRIAIRPIQNKTEQHGLEDKFTLRIRDEFLRDGRYPLVPISEADGYVEVTVLRYILRPIQYDAVLAPTSYKLKVLIDIDFIDRTTNRKLWSEQAIEGTHVYAAPILQGGKTEEQAREEIWDQLSRDVVKRVVEGFGSVSGVSQRSISREAPAEQGKEPVLPPKPVNPNPY